ncbi:SDR family oxidoreductase [Paenibacillus methanolicus]|uniref:Acyl transferase domain-containing protein n=1 Tax=Paenibacillus methanolicus TaxID=582686 RepID=A0A5S5CEH1_9BACL|nr:SDR family oxidoreductase [Paenibacillus methanolicus]TYP76740.1 acyl transferase domain-containing protein [Paenibacillus methanolicus]
MLKFDQVQLKELTTLRSEKASHESIAVIGIGLRFPLADRVETFWDNLKQQVDCVRDIPDSREQDARDLMQHLGIRLETDSFAQIAYLDEIDTFDYGFFHLSPKEASLMDPNQRLFLQTAVTAIEDAGYGGHQLAGSRTGVYVGYGSEAVYHRLIASVEPNALPMAVAGNSKPIIASRLAYGMDFKGPNMLIDTTCSSSLVAVHMACQALRNGECETAIAGGSQIHLIPARQTEIGIESSDGRTKTFDDRSDGTGSGEGVAAILLKPLRAALRDNDRIYAVIKGSAVNHDGASNGITAPNALAQEDVLVRAWENAGIDPESISYIEAHGTGTKLGDPIEIDGITKAFRRYTDRKGFCGVGSVKSNVGHLDHAAGIAGLIKAILAVHHKEIPATMHYQVPNRNIRFENSPVYVVDRHLEWERGQTPRRCGVSSFGISGTNCHVVLEEAPAPAVHAEADSASPYVLTISARSESAMREWIERYQERLLNHKEANIRDICYVSNTGRGHYSHRLAVVAASMNDLRNKLSQLHHESLNDLKLPGVFYGYQRAGANKPNGDSAHDLTRQLTLGEESRQSAAERLSELYVQGEDIDWETFYQGARPRKVSLPTYPFAKNRCWLEKKESIALSRSQGTMPQAPLIDRCLVKSMSTEIYATSFASDRHWVLNEHRMMNEGLLVGTGYLEMVLQAVGPRLDGAIAEFRDVQFIQPLRLRDDEAREVHLVLDTGTQPRIGFTIASATEDENGCEHWVEHATGTIELRSREATIPRVDIEAIRNRASSDYLIPDIDAYQRETIFEFGPRWRNLAEMYVGETELLSYLQTPEAFEGEIKDYTLHPALMDNALTTVPLVRRNLPESMLPAPPVFLPFSYRSIKLYTRLRKRLYSHVRLKEPITEQTELVAFDITFADESGQVIAEIEDYTLKKVRAAAPVRDEDPLFHQLQWVSFDTTLRAAANVGEVLLLANDNKWTQRFRQELQSKGIPAIQASWGDEYRKLGPDEYAVNGSQDDFERLIADLNARNLTHVVHLYAFDDQSVASEQELDRALEKGVYSLLHAVKAIGSQTWNQAIEIVCAVKQAHEVTGQEDELFPQHASLLGLAKVIPEEYANVRCRCIDADETFSPELLTEALLDGLDSHAAAFRQGQWYREQLRELDIRERTEKPFQLQRTGVYLVTGGTGGIGLELGKFLASREKINLVFLQRTPMPDRSEWEQIRQANDPASKLVRQIAAIESIERSGANVECHAVDVASYEAMRSLLLALRARLGSIRGVIHSAGVAGDGLMWNKTDEDFARVLAPKIAGTWHLHQLTAQDPLDFFVLCSSYNTIAGFAGQSDYTAANAYLDAFGAYRAKQNQPVLTINWPVWKETGMAFDRQASEDGLLKAIPTSQALHAFERLLRTDVSRAHVGELNWNGSFHGKTIRDLGIDLSPSLKQEIDRIAARGSLPSAADQHEEVVLEGNEAGVYSDWEKRLAQLWHDILGFSSFRLDDDFYDLGGDSISAMMLVSDLKSKYQIEVPLQEIFRRPTIQQLAQFIADKAEVKSGSEGSRSISLTAEKAYYPVSSVQRRMYLIHQANRRDLSYQLPRMIQIDGAFDRARFVAAFQQLVRRHETLRTSFHIVEGQIVQKIHPQLELAIEAFEPSDEGAEELMARFVRPFDLEQAPLIRVGLKRQSEDLHYLLFDIHHIIADGTSLTLLVKEFVQLYQGHSLAELPIQYKDYAIWHNELAGTNEMETKAAYWHRQFAGSLPVLELPLDYPRGSQPDQPEGSQISFKADSALSSALKAAASSQGLTLFMMLFGAYSLLLSKCSGQEEVIVGFPIAGRERSETEPLIGMFVNTLAIRSFPQEEKSLGQYLEEIKQSSLEAYANQDYPFEKLIEALDQTWEPDRNPLFDALFVMQNMESPVFRLDELTFTPLETRARTIPFDLELEVIEDQGEIRFHLFYAGRLFKKETMERFSADFVHLLNIMADNGDRLIRDVRLASRLNKADDLLADVLDISF